MFVAGKVEYPKNLTQLQFGALTVLSRATGYENENKMWLCKCDCGRPNCKGTVIMRRGNLTRKVNWKLTCGADGKDVSQTVKTKFEKGIVQKNSKTGIPGVNHSSKYPGMYRARICLSGKRITKDNLSFADAITTRKAWEQLFMEGL